MAFTWLSFDLNFGLSNHNFCSPWLSDDKHCGGNLSGRRKMEKQLGSHSPVAGLPRAALSRPHSELGWLGVTDALHASLPINSKVQKAGINGQWTH